ncbi:MAG: DUF192 domain-containing protein [Patescibacteria group bacterium]|nr:DUF192 domain-containing protein [Patescibacteria group bacterium]
MKLLVNYLPWYASWKGLLGTKSPKPLYFTTRFGIHTFGMQYAIDVVILDNRKIMRKLKSDLSPNQFFFWNPLFSHVVELPSGTIKKNNFRIGKPLEIVIK